VQCEAPRAVGAGRKAERQVVDARRGDGPAVGADRISERREEAAGGGERRPVRLGEEPVAPRVAV